MRRRHLWILAFLLFIGACASPVVNDPSNIIIPAVEKGEYAMLIPFNSSKTRQYHGTYLGRADILEIGSRLENKSKTHFPVEDFVLGDGQVLTLDRLATLVTREAADNPQGLNPPKGSSFPSGISNISILDAVVVADVIELNFYTGSASKPKLEGISLAIVLNQNVASVENGVDVVRPISDERLFAYGTDMGRKLEAYMRKIPDMENIPIYITLYNTSTTDATLPGKFVADGFFTGRTGQFVKNVEQWVLFPSDAADKLDSVTASEMKSLRTALKEFIPETIAIVGQARYVSQKLDFLRINVIIQAKTFAEVHALTQYLGRLLENFSDKGATIVADIKNYNETVALIQRDPDGNLSVIYTY
jgi:protein involved in sex pheromone biosynthesis